MSAAHARKKPFLRLATAAVAMVAALGMAACSGGAGSASSSSGAQVGDRTPEQIQEAGEIVIGIFSDKAPFGYIDADGKPAGYDVVYGDRIAADLGVTAKYVPVDAAARTEVLASNKVNITLANFTVTPERAEKVDFANPYFKVSLGVVSPTSAEITDVSQLAGKTLIVTKGTTAEAYFEANHPEVKLLKFDQYSDAYQALEDGRGDAFSTDNTEVIAWAIAAPRLQRRHQEPGRHQLHRGRRQEGQHRAARLAEQRARRTRRGKLLPQGLRADPRPRLR